MKGRQFDVYFTLSEIGARLPFSRETLLAMMKRGEFSPAGADGRPDLSNVLFDDAARCYLVPLSGLEHYRVRHALTRDGLISEIVQTRLRAPAPERPEAGPGVHARTIGEARRRLASEPTGAVANPVAGKHK